MNILSRVTGSATQIRGSWDTVRSNWFISLTHKFILGLFILSVAILLWRWRMLPPMVPLWYSRPWGTDQLASPYWLLVLPVSSVLLYGINFLIGMYVTAEYLIFTQMLFLSSLIVSILSFVALVKILFLVS